MQHEDAVPLHQIRLVGPRGLESYITNEWIDKTVRLVEDSY